MYRFFWGSVYYVKWKNKWNKKLARIGTRISARYEHEVTNFIDETIS